MPSPAAYKTGSKFPELEKGQLRLYSMRFCPFAERARLILAHKKIPHETVNIHLKEKPDWFIERTPFGAVPVVEKDGKLVYESLITCDYLDEIYPGERLNPADPYQRALDKILIELHSKAVVEFFKILYDKGDKKENVEEYKKKMDPVEKAIGERGNFFSGEKVGMVDYMIWPWIERLESLMKCKAVSELLPSDRFPKMQAWIGRMIKLPAVQEAMFDSDSHMKFMKSMEGGKANYDIGL